RRFRICNLKSAICNFYWLAPTRKRFGIDRDFPAPEVPGPPARIGRATEEPATEFPRQVRAAPRFAHLGPGRTRTFGPVPPPTMDGFRDWSGACQATGRYRDQP